MKPIELHLESQTLTAQDSVLLHNCWLVATSLLDPWSPAGACRGSSCALGGCINDAHCMAFLLTSKFGFRQDNMRMLLDDNPNFQQRPTRQNMMQGFQWLIAGCQPGDSLFFHYSGQSSSLFRTEIYGISPRVSTLPCKQLTSNFSSSRTFPQISQPILW